MTDTGKIFQNTGHQKTNGVKHPFFCGEARILKIRPTINILEQKSILALAAYAGFNDNSDQESILAVLCKRFGINDYRDLPRTSYDEAVRFLVDEYLEDPTDTKEAAND